MLAMTCVSRRWNNVRCLYNLAVRDLDWQHFMFTENKFFTSFVVAHAWSARHKLGSALSHFLPPTLWLACSLDLFTAGINVSVEQQLLLLWSDCKTKSHRDCLGEGVHCWFIKTKFWVSLIMSALSLTRTHTWQTHALPHHAPLHSYTHTHTMNPQTHTHTPWTLTHTPWTLTHMRTHTHMHPTDSLMSP